MQLTAAQLEFLSGLNKSPTGRALVDLIQAMLAESDKALRVASSEEVFRCQGRSQALAGLLTDMSEAQQRLDRNRQSRRLLPAFEG